ncbi:MAG: phosphoglycerate kinase [Patescibacteria group bacterium]|nr:phosphoglycerate kinase [Patescibacteria group bacterium]
MQVITPRLIQDKKVLLRMDIDVPLGNSKFKIQNSKVVLEDFRLKAGLPTLNLCLEHARSVVIMGHLGRPEGQFVADLSVEPIYDWLFDHGFGSYLKSGKLKILENLRFEKGEEEVSLEYAKELAQFAGGPACRPAGFFINEAFASYHPAASTTVLPTLLPHAAGLCFAQEIDQLTTVLHNPKRPLVVILGGAKIEDKLPVIQMMSKLADIVLVGGKLALELKEKPEIAGEFGHKVAVGELNSEGLDMTPQTIQVWDSIIAHARMVVWNGPVGKMENSKLEGQEMGSSRGTYELARVILQSQAEVIVGGGDTVGFLGQVGLLEDFESKGFVSTGGGAMLKFLTDETLPTITALD